ncbi:hypothetical protein ACGFI9_26395 [Micromonospora sp. NPDC048930]|uniref:hypothetical protein n=1 Tax=Micromonospora sp. NPDC048930 TaxID=3364261 RepID=UPI00371D5563
MTRPEEPTEALPTRAMPPVTDPGATVDLDRTVALGGAGPTAHLAATDATIHLGAAPHLDASDATVHLAGPDRTADLASPDATAYLGTPDATVHRAGPGRTAHLGAPDATVHLAGADRTMHLGSPEATPNPGATDRTVTFGPADAATTHFGPPGTASAPPGTASGPATSAFGGPTVAPTGPATSAYGEPTGAYPQGAAQPGTAGVPAQPAPGGEVRFGPGVPATPPDAPAWPTAAPARRPRPLWRRVVSVLSTLLTLALVAVVGLYLWERLRPLEVEGVTVAVPQPAGDRCDVTVDVVATVRTNGRSGVIRYQWFRSDAPPGALLSERVGRGQRSATLTLRWTFSGAGATTETATVNIIEPSPVQAGTQVAYRCRRG